MLKNAIKKTALFLENKTKAERKKIGQFFTSENTARYMASLYDMSILNGKQTITVLDAGAGSGILAIAVSERLVKEVPTCNIHLVCYENNDDIVSLLDYNLRYAQDINKGISYEIRQENYILSQELSYQNNDDAEKYDIVIGNPPYMKINKETEEALAMPNICYGAPNMYFLFAAMSLYNLKEQGELVYIIPRSWTSGAYFKSFRTYFLQYGKLIHAHLFVSRNKVFSAEDVLQETIIIKVCKMNDNPQNVVITSTETNEDFSSNRITKLLVPYNIAVSEKEDKYVYLVTTQDEIDVLQKINKFQETLPDMGIKMKTGLTVDFRNREALRQKAEDNNIPLFYSQHIKQDGHISFPVGKENEYICTEQAGLKQKNGNYLFVKRFTSKEESKRLQCGMYFSSEFPIYEYISTQNKLNFIDTIKPLAELTESEVYGLYVIFNSDIYDKYYRILNGSTQVNSTEINSMPVPTRKQIVQMGELIKSKNDFTTATCDNILEEVTA